MVTHQFPVYITCINPIIFDFDLHTYICLCFSHLSVRINVLVQFGVVIFLSINTLLSSSLHPAYITFSQSVSV